MSAWRFCICDVRSRPGRPDTSAAPHRFPSLPGGGRRGFTFTEVLFAVMLLGIGFVMVAAIFPVAIQQSQANRDDTIGVVVAKSGAKIMQTIRFDTRDLERSAQAMEPNGQPRAGVVYPFDDHVKHPPTYTTLFSKLEGNLLNSSDRRFAWVPLGYKLAVPMRFSGQKVIPSYEVYIVAVACRNKAAYDEDDLAGFTFIPKQVCFKLEDGDLDPDLIYFSDPRSDKNYSAFDDPAAAEGAFVLVGDDQIPSGHFLSGKANGRIYRLGVKRPDVGVGVWELLPGHDMQSYVRDPHGVEFPEDIPPMNAPNRPAKGYMVGRGYVDPLDGAAADPRNRRSFLEGPAQDLFAIPVTIPLR